MQKLGRAYLKGGNVELPKDIGPDGFYEVIRLDDGRIVLVPEHIPGKYHHLDEETRDRLFDESVERLAPALKALS